MKKVITCIILLLSLCSLLPNNAIADAVKAEIDSPWVVIGMPRILHFEVTVPEGASVEWPQLQRQGGFPAADLDDESKRYFLEFGPDTDFGIDTLSHNGNMVTIGQDLSFFAFDSASMVISPLAFVVNATDTLYTGPMALRTGHYFEMPDDPTAIAEPKPVMEPPFVIWDYLWWIIWILVAVAMIVAGYYIWRYLKTHPRNHSIVQIQQEPLLPAHVEAMNALDALGEKKLWQDGKYKQFHTELTDIIRHYLERRYNLPAMEKTSDEIMSELVDLQINQKSSFNNLKEVLQLADLVKFAKYEPLMDENQMSMMNSRLFVEQTKEVIVEQGTEDALETYSKE